MKLKFNAEDECQNFAKAWEQLSNTQSTETSVYLDIKNNNECHVIANETLYYTSYINQ